MSRRDEGPPQGTPAKLPAKLDLRDGETGCHIVHTRTHDKKAIQFITCPELDAPHGRFQASERVTLRCIVGQIVLIVWDLNCYPARMRPDTPAIALEVGTEYSIIAQVTSHVVVEANEKGGHKVPTDSLFITPDQLAEIQAAAEAAGAAGTGEGAGDDGGDVPLGEPQ